MRNRHRHRPDRAGYCPRGLRPYPVFDRLDEDGVCYAPVALTERRALEITREVWCGVSLGDMLRVAYTGRYQGTGWSTRKVPWGLREHRAELETRQHQDRVAEAIAAMTEIDSRGESVL